MPLPPNAWRRMLSAMSFGRAIAPRRRIAVRRLALEPLEVRQLLAVLVPVGAADLAGNVAINAQYSFASQPAESEQASQDFYGTGLPSSGVVQIDRARLMNCFSDGASGFIERQEGGQSVELSIDGHTSVVHYADPPENTITGRSSSVSYSLAASDPIVYRIDPSVGEQAGDLVGVTIGLLADGRIYGSDQNTAPSGSATAQGSYSYDYRILGPTSQVLASRTGSGSLSQRLGVQPPLEDFASGPINVPIGGRIEIRMRIDGSINTSDLSATAQAQSSMTLSLGFGQSEIVAESMAWNVAASSDQSARFLDFSYYIDAARDALEANAEIEFYWAAGSTLSSVLGDVNAPIYRWSIDQPAERTSGSHAGSIALSQLSTPPDGAANLLMVIDRANTVAEGSKANNLLAVTALPEIEMGSLVWNARRDQDPYGGWRGVDVQYEVRNGGPAAAGQVAFYWASGTTLATRIGDALAPHGTDTALGLHQLNEPALFGIRPANAQYVLAVFDPLGQVPEWNEQNNVAALAVHSAEEILNGSLDLDPLGARATSPTSLTVWFKPGGGAAGQPGRYTMSEAEVALGVDHFNWYQQIQSVPGHWTLYQDQTTSGAASGSQVAVPLPWLDPSDRVPDQSYLVLQSSMANQSERFAANPNDDRIYYYNEPGFDHSQQVNVAGVTRSSSMVFTDAPRVPMEYLAAGEAWQFITSVEGVDSQGRAVSLPAVGQRTFTWRANTVYDRNDPAHPITGGAIFLQALDESKLPPAVAGGIFEVTPGNVTPPVAVADASTTIVDTSVVVRVMANDYDPDGRPLRISYAGGAQHGAVSVSDAGTPDDFSDDYVRYTPGVGFAGQDGFDYTVTRIGVPGGYAFGRATIAVLPALGGLGAMGDSLTDEYAGQGFAYAKNWVELLATTEGVSFGLTGSWSEPRLSGYEYDWARAGATTLSALDAGQHTGLAQQMADGLVSHAVVAIGQDDFMPGSQAYVGIYMQGLPVLGGWTAEQIAAYSDSVVANIQAAVATIRPVGGKLVLTNLVDFGAAPLAVAQYPDAARRQSVGTVLADINRRIADLAAQYRVPLADLAGVSAALFGSGASPTASQMIGGTLFTNTSGEGPQNMFVADGLHPNTIVQAAYANVVLEAFGLGYGENVGPMSEREMVQRAGATYGGQDTLNLNWPAYVVAAPNHLPVAETNRYVAEQGRVLAVDAVAGVLGNDSDADLDPLSAKVVDGGPRHGTLAMAASGAFTYAPAVGYVGMDYFSYVAGDGYGQSQAVVVQIQVVAVGAGIGDSLGLYAPEESVSYLRNSNTTGAADWTMAFGAPGAGWLPVAGDWDGNGSATVGLYDPASSVFFLKNSSDGGYADMVVSFGAPGAGWLPIAGDFDGDGVATVGLYDPHDSIFYLTDNPAGGFAGRVIGYGAAGAGWLPLAGDWNGDGVDTIGLYDPGTSVFYLRDFNTPGMSTLMFGYGAAGWKPIVGDWNSNGVDTIGLFDPTSSGFYLRNQNSAGYADVQFGFGQPDANWVPVAGNWDGTKGGESAASAFSTGAKAAQNPGALDPKAVDQVDLAAMVALELAQAATGDQADEALAASTLL